jgi:hypothetical protein
MSNIPKKKKECFLHMHESHIQYVLVVQLLYT